MARLEWNKIIFQVEMKIFIYLNNACLKRTYLYCNGQPLEKTNNMFASLNYVMT